MSQSFKQTITSSSAIVLECVCVREEGEGKCIAEYLLYLTLQMDDSYGLLCAKFRTIISHKMDVKAHSLCTKYTYSMGKSDTTNLNTLSELKVNTVIMFTLHNNHRIPISHQNSRFQGTPNSSPTTGTQSKYKVWTFPYMLCSYSQLG